MITKEVLCKSVLNRSGIPGADYCINPYTGCGHGCRYCYAEFMRRYSNHKEPWGSFVDAKVNAPDVLERQLRGAKKGMVYFSSVTDPYQPLEKKYELTRRCLEVLLKHDYPVSIQTKSSLVERDLDLIGRFQNADVGFTVCMGNKQARTLEPNASPPSERMATLRKFHEAGIRTYVFLGPVISGVTDVNDIVRRTYEWADHYFIDRLNMKGCASKNRLQAGSDDYYNNIKKELSSVLKNKPHTFCF